MPDLLSRLQPFLADHYRFERELGRGGMAFVFLARDLKHDRLVAIKVLRPDLAAAIGSDRFLREIRTAARLQYPNILPLFDSGEADDLLYYVMPYVEGESLRARLERESQLPIHDAVRIAQQVAGALAYAHNHDVVHRDIKPENILLAGEQCLVADFGVAKAITLAGSDRLTETGMAVGTPAYMSPEQAGGAARIDGRSDLYALGCVLYEMLTGAPPFTGPSAQAVMARHSVDPVPSLRTVRKAVPQELEQVIMKALEKVPGDRFVSGSELAQALSQVAPKPVPRTPRRLRLNWRTLLAAAIAATALVVVSSRWVGRTSVAPIDRLAVLPLTNLMGDTAQNYLVDGLHDVLITELAKLPGITVISRSSVLGYRNTTKGASAIARELNVDAVVQGSVFRTEDSVRMIVQLLDGRSDRHLWAESFGTGRGLALNAPLKAARAIAGRLGGPVAAGDIARLSRRRSVDPQASDLYVKGRYFCSQWTRAGFEHGSRYFRQAIDLEPTFAEAYAGLGECYSWLPLFTFAAPEEAFPKAKAAVERALSLDSTLGTAHATLGLVKLMFDWDLIGPERDFERAVRFSPGSKEVHLNRSTYLVAVARFDEAVAAVQRAIEIDPLSFTTSLQLGWVNFIARRYDESIVQLNKALELDPGHGLTQMELAWNYSMQGLHERAVDACEQALGKSGSSDLQVVLASCAWVYARAGERKQARHLLGVVLRLGKKTWLDPYNMISIYEALGDRDEAFRWLDRAISERSSAIPFLATDPSLDALRPDPRFVAAVRRAGLSPKPKPSTAPKEPAEARP